MKKMKIAAVAAASLVLAACGSGDTTSDNAASGDNGSDIKVAVILKTLSSEYWSYVAAGVEAAEAELGVEVELVGAANETAYDEQTNQIETILADDSIDAVVISPLQPDSVSAVLSGTDKPILFVDTDAPYEDKIAFIGTGNEAATTAGGEVAGELAGEGAKALWIGGIQGDTTNDARERGFEAGLKSKGVEIVARQYAQNLADTASSVMENVLVSNPEITVVVTNNDEMAAGAGRAVQAAGRDDIIIFGVDGIQAGVQNVIDGVVTGSVAQDPYNMGYLAVENAVKVAKGETIDEVIDTGSSVITSENAEEYLATLQEQLGK